MTLDPFSFVVGIVACLVFCGVLGAVLEFADWRQAKKERDEALDRLLAEVGVACIEQPTNVRVN